MFADMNTGSLGPDRIKYTPDFLGRIRFHVEAFMLSQAARKEDVND